MTKRVTAAHALILLNALVLLASQLLIKVGLARKPLFLRRLGDVWTVIVTIATTPVLLAGVLIGGASTLLWIVVLSRQDLSYAVPTFNAFYFCLLVASSALVLHEQIDARRIVGIAVILAGVAIVSTASR